MTDLAHDAVLLGIPIDTWRLYAGDDPDYELWVSLLVDRVTSSKRRMAKELEVT